VIDHYRRRLVTFKVISAAASLFKWRLLHTGSLLYDVECPLGTESSRSVSKEEQR